MSILWKQNFLQGKTNNCKKNPFKIIMKSAIFIFNFDSEEEARIVSESLNPEIDNKIPKTNIKVNLSKQQFTLEIKAKDVSSLRAAINSYLRWINTALNVKKSV